MTHELALEYQRSAESWAMEYSKNAALKWQAMWAAKRAAEAWKTLLAA